MPGNGLTNTFLNNCTNKKDHQKMNMRIHLISLIWIFFTLVFAGLAFVSFSQAGKQISAFRITARPMASHTSVKAEGMDIDKPLADFVNDFNGYIQNYNKSARSQNFWAALGYLAAGIVSLISIFISKGQLNQTLEFKWKNN